MGKFDGMDPKLVRDLLAEVKNAVTQMRSVEGRVGQVMSGAGLATQTTHRPVQVADAAEVMVRDVTARLGLLEKKADHPRVGDQPKEAAPTVGSDAKDGDEPKKDRGDERSKYENPRADDGTPADKPDAKTGEDKPDAKTGDKPDAKADDKPDAKTGEDKPDAKTDDKPDAKADDKPDAKTGEDKPDAKADDKPDAKADDKPDAKTDDKPDAKTGEDKPDAKACDDDKPDAKTGEDKPDAKTGDDKPDADVTTPDTGDEPKDDDIASRRDRGADSDSGIIDTPAKDHPDDSDPHKPRVIVVDGVKVLQVPIDPPTAEELRALLDDIDKVQPAEMPSVSGDASTHGTDVNAWPKDGSDVVSIDAKPLDPGALSTAGDHARDIQPAEMPRVEVPAGEYGTGEWAPRHISPDGQPGTIDTGNIAASTGHNPSTGDIASTTGTPSMNDISGSTADTAATAQTADSAPTAPTTDSTPTADAPTATTDTGECQATDTGTRSTGDGPVVTPTDPPGQQVPDHRAGDVTPTNPPGQQVPDHRAGDVTPTNPPGQQVPDHRAGDTAPTNPSGQRATDVSMPTVGEPVVVPPTEPSADQGASTAPPTTDGATPPPADTSTRETAATTVYAAQGADAGKWAGDGSDVVSIDVKPLDPDALRTLVEHARDVQPMDMPGVQVPEGEYGKGGWALRDIQPDGPPGTIEPGTHGRSV
ncbi:hypothetical protein AB0H88_20725 [Nonomuraea sp. NPDC050680]|uniref:hypothetical protein n=1 Tax=Nonomuraea sp. NPDC050680 TaxID=3154630 RepID=UPI0033D60BB0